MKQRFTVRRYLVVNQEGEAEAHDFILVVDFDAIPNSHFRKATENKGKRRRMACGALVIVHQTPPDFKAGVTHEKSDADKLREGGSADH